MFPVPYSIIFLILLKKFTFLDWNAHSLICERTVHCPLFVIVPHPDSDSTNLLNEPWTHIPEVYNSAMVLPVPCPIGYLREKSVKWACMCRRDARENKYHGEKKLHIPDESLSTSVETLYQSRHHRYWPVSSILGKTVHDIADKRHWPYNCVANPTGLLARLVVPGKRHAGSAQRTPFGTFRTLHACRGLSRYICIWQVRKEAWWVLSSSQTKQRVSGSLVAQSTRSHLAWIRPYNISAADSTISCCS